MSELLREQYFASDMPDGYFDLLPQQAVRCVPFPSTTKHNAVWDFLLEEDGTAYVPLCGELSQPLSVQLYRFDTNSGKFHFCFDAAKEFFVGNREIPPSKIHTSLSKLNDGRLLMTTHTTARSPRHPYWLFDSYFEHIHEGYPGSHMLIYDPENGTVKNLGIPVKRDSIYGGCYDPAHNAFFFTTFLKGKLFRFDLDKFELRDLGQITEGGSYCVFPDGRGGFFTSSRTGHIFRIDGSTLEISDLGVVGAEEEELYRWNFHRVLAHWTPGPDGKIYFTMHFSNNLYILDPETRKIDALSLAPQGAWKKAPPHLPKGHVFDSEGVLWYLESRESANAYPGGTLHLFRRDIFHGGEPEYMGLVGIAEHNCAMVCHVAIDANDVMHFPDGNHGEDMAWMAAVDLKKVRGNAAEARERCRDVWAYCSFADGKEWYPGDDFEQASADYRRFRQYMIADAEYHAAFATSNVPAERVTVARCWERLPFEEDHTVRMLRFLADGALEIRCGSHGKWRFLLQDEVLHGPEHLSKEENPLPEVALPAIPDSLTLPARSGRRLLAGVTAAAQLADGWWLLGSADAVFSLWNPVDGTLFSLGAIGAHGPCRALAASGNGDVIYGITGDADDLGHIIRFDRRRGLCDLGRARHAPPDSVVASNTELSTLAVNFDGSQCAVGAAGRLATVYLFTFLPYHQKGVQK